MKVLCRKVQSDARVTSFGREIVETVEACRFCTSSSRLR
jgi:hypothetical protein